MRNPILDYLLDELEQEFGDLDNEGGCYLNNGRWLSISNIVQLIERVDEDY